MSLRDQILAANDMPQEQMTIPEWGNVTVTVRAISADEWDAIDSKKQRAQAVATCLLDDRGTPVFTVKDVEALGKKSIGPMGRIYAKILKLSGIASEDNAEKND